MTTERPVRLDGIRAAGGVLDRIVEARVDRLARARLERPIQVLKQEIADRRERRSMAAALSRFGNINIIAELKKASPSRGVLSERFDPASIAEAYATAGAAAISILTEEDFFGGSLEHLRIAVSSGRIPVLRKDFIIDEYQVYESAAAGADAILLIVAILNDELLEHLLERAREIGLAALVEVHTAGEMDRAAAVGAEIIGVNNRDLTSLNVSLETSFRLADRAPAGAILVSESGIFTGHEIRQLSASGFSAFLIGERFMTAEDPGSALGELLREASPDSNRDKSRL